ncbi:MULTISPECIES: glutamate/aspartate:proton symporter GltP [unclassified Gilliamella]|uniref:glutamate/aspartate:proton symporter GltP n=1 Tax=unclassified Gilliamella TaxID=2685620 RepID=UPI001C69934B|nr:glutamate/aspartate:proton symporter GltP [Gilliamella sp. ESL0441]QYN45683.1 glutamate/aspartate:proton symporter GltP [Gilliamella sp. ESL0441]
MKKILSNLAWQIFIALILGVAVGAYLFELSDSNHPLHSDYQFLIINIFQPAGDIFIRLIKMIVLPIILSTLTLGIAGIGGSKRLGMLGFKTILYFEIITTIAILLGLFWGNFFAPGAGIDSSTLASADMSKYTKAAEELSGKPHGLIVMILDMIPANIFKAMSDGAVLPVIFFCVFFGLGLMSLPDKQREPFLFFLKVVSDTMFKVTNMIMRYAPIGVFALITVTVAKYGFASLLPLLKLILTVYSAMIIFTLVILGLVCKMCRFNIFTLLKILKEELVIAFSTASSETALPKIIEKMEAYGAPKAITSFVIPTGYSFNLDGSTLYQSITVIFLAQLSGMDLSILDQIIIVITLMIASKGIAGVPGASILVLSATLGSIDIPLDYIGYIMGVERILDMGRTVVNVVGNALAAIVIARWEHVFDDKKARAYEQEYLK